MTKPPAEPARLPLPHARDEYAGACGEIVKYLKLVGERGVKKFRLAPWQIKQRVKEDTSIRSKLERLQKSDASLGIAAIWDIAGVRVIVESERCVAALRDRLRQQRKFPVLEVKDYVCNPRPDGYRGVHMILETVPIADVVPVELQIRSILQHQWAELSHREFYKSIEEIPPNMLEQMQSLSELLRCCEVESDHLRRNRLLDNTRREVQTVLHLGVLERLREDGCEPRSVGALACLLTEFDRQLRRAMVSDGRPQRDAVEAMRALCRECSDARVKPTLTKVTKEVGLFAEVLPGALFTSGQATPRASGDNVAPREGGAGA